MTPRHIASRSVVRDDQLLSDLLIPEQSEKPPQDLLAEYGDLRKQLEQTNTTSLQVVSSIIVMTGLLVNVAFANRQFIPHVWLLFVAAEFVSFIGLQLNTGRLTNTHIIAAYIKIFIEPHTKYIQWETRLSRFRKREKAFYRKGIIIHQLWLYSVIIFSNFFLASYFFFQEYNSIIPIIIGASITLGFFINQFLICAKINRERSNLYEKPWIEVLKEERGKR